MNARFERVLATVAVIAVAAFVAGAVVTIAAPSVEAKFKVTTPSIFGSKEGRSSKMKKFKKWLGVMGRYTKEKPSELNKCRLTPTNPCYVTKWRIYLNQIANQPKRKQLDLVNAYLNRYLYKIDPSIYSKKDYWATPKQFFYRSGDCEDFAISKYASLVNLGFPKKDMRLVVLQDLNLKVGHAVLMVKLDGKSFILDNQIKQVVDSKRIRHYKPIYSINEFNWWLHRS